MYLARILEGNEDPCFFLRFRKRFGKSKFTLQLCGKIILRKAHKDSLPGFKSERASKLWTIFSHFRWCFIEKEGGSPFFEGDSLNFLNLYCKFSATEVLWLRRFNKESLGTLKSEFNLCIFVFHIVDAALVKKWIIQKLFFSILNNE